MSRADNFISLGTLLSACIDASQQAGSLIRKIWKSGELNVQQKGKDDPFTKADIEAQQLICGLLKKSFPKLTMIGEEKCDIPDLVASPNLQLINPDLVPFQYRNVDISDVVVFIDPLDATREFTEGILDACMTLIGIAYKGDAVAGVMSQPFVDENRDVTIYGMLGAGSFGLHQIERNEKGITLGTTRSHPSAAMEEAIRKINPAKVVRVGGAGYKSLLVLQRKLDVYLYVTSGTKKWDTCGPEAIVRSLGGQLTDANGRRLSYFNDGNIHNNNGILCTLNPVHHSFVVQSTKG